MHFVNRLHSLSWSDWPTFFLQLFVMLQMWPLHYESNAMFPCSCQEVITDKWIPLLQINTIIQALPMAAMVTAEGESGRLYTHQTENVCADPPSKPASQDMLACITPGETDREVAAWGLVPATQRSRWKSSSTSTVLPKYRDRLLMCYI